jgi:hypothetical protein
MIHSTYRSLKASFFQGSLALVILCVFAGVGFSNMGMAAEPNAIATETIKGRITGKNGFVWRCGYDIQVRNGQLLVSVRINPIPTGGVTKPELDRVIPSWKKGIERIWSEKFAIVPTSRKRIPIVINVSFKGPRFHHDVIVRPGGGRTDEMHWNLMDSPATVAHEFGHMLGVFDEYKRGATATRAEIIDKTSIMTSKPTEGLKTYARHYENFLLWFVSKTQRNDAVLVALNVQEKKS